MRLSAALTADDRQVSAYGAVVWRRRRAGACFGRNVHMSARPPLTTGDVARYCHVTPNAVFKWIQSGKLEAFTTPGGHHRIERGDFLAFLKRYDMPVPSDLVTEEKLRVLVVDDDPDVVVAIAKELKRAGYNVETAGDGFEAGSKVRSFHPDLLVLDIGLPGIDGFDVMRSLKKDPSTKRIRIVVITGRVKDDVRERARKAGAEAVVFKPLNMGRLMKHVAKLAG
jgi:excisionase family DNA binding protein